MSEREATVVRVTLGEASQYERGRARICWPCGGEFTVREVVVHMVHGGLHAYVCPECLSAGKDGAAERMRRQAESARRRADYLERCAADLPSAQTWPSAEDFERLALELEAERRAGVTVGEIDEDDIPF